MGAHFGYKYGYLYPYIRHLYPKSTRIVYEIAMLRSDFPGGDTRPPYKYQRIAVNKSCIKHQVGLLKLKIETNRTKLLKAQKDLDGRIEAN